MSAGNTFENDLMKLIFNGTAISNIADNAASAPLASLYLSLHTADPGEAGSQTTSEVAYTSYVRKAATRDNTAWTVSGATATLAAVQTFATCTGSSATATYFGIGTDSSGAGKLLFSGAISPTISITTGVIPKLTTSTTVTLD